MVKVLQKVMHMKEENRMVSNVYKIIFADMEKEEEWLNEMAQKGFNFMDNFIIRYTFSEGTPNEYIYRIEMLENSSSHPVSRQYFKFLEETGVECVSTSGKWAYFRKKAADGPFDLYSDSEAKIKHYKRTMSYVLTLLFINLIILGMNLTIGITRNLPLNIILSVAVFFFTILLLRNLFHNIKKVKELKEDSHVHE